MNLKDIKNRVLNGERIGREEALFLGGVDLIKLKEAADEIRLKFMGNKFDMCAVLSVKGGRCSENCKFCSQSAISKAKIPEFDVRDEDFVSNDAGIYSGKGVSHYCQVSSGRKMSKADIKVVCKNVKRLLEETDLIPCVSLGLLDREDLIMLKEAGVKRVHNNLESSREHFTKLCTSHTYEEKMELMRLVHDLGMELCSGGILGIGESFEDRIDMAFTLREFEPESVPINVLNPVVGTPMEKMERVSKEDLERIIAIFRFILPKSFLRLAAGRNFIDDSGLECFKACANATITGDMVTVKGISIEEDLENVRKLGYDFV